MKKIYKKKQKEGGYYSADPLPLEEELQKFYAENYYQSPKSSSYRSEYNEKQIKYKQFKCNVLIHALETSCNLSQKTFLDIGSGEGFLLNAADEKGFDVTGLDFSAFGIEKFFPNLISQHIAGDIYKNLDKLITQGKMFARCAAINVLEHVLDPELFLFSIKQVMEPEGVIAITVPNDFSDLQNLAFQNRMIDNEFWFVPPHHLHYFNTDTLPRFIKKNGFKIVDAFTDFPIDLYLLHKGSNYIKDKSCGFDANNARIDHDLMIYEKHGINNYINYYRAMFNVGIGRNITIIARQR